MHYNILAFDHDTDPLLPLVPFRMASSNSDPKTSGAPPTPRYVSAASDGDVEFILTASGESTIIRVSSVVLSYASSVFRALLGPNFKEGQALRGAERPQQVPLPDDGWESMGDLCSLLHYGRDLDLLKPIKPALPLSLRLVELSATADKYDCILAVSSVVEVHFTHFTHVLEPAEDGILC